VQGPGLSHSARSGWRGRVPAVRRRSATLGRGGRDPTATPGPARLRCRRDPQLSLPGTRRHTRHGAADVVTSHTGSAAPALNWPPEYANAFDTLLARNAPASGGRPGRVEDLPIVPVAAQPGTAPRHGSPSCYPAAGVGGLDKEVAAALSSNGIPVVVSIRCVFLDRAQAEILAARSGRISTTT